MRVMRLMGLLSLLLISVNVCADTIADYTIDPAKTVINFTWRYLGTESPKASFSKPEGDIQLNLENPLLSRADVSIPVKTLSTFMRLIDRELLNSGDFFLPEKHPVIRFRSTGITETAGSDGWYRVAGMLSVNGISQPVILDARPVGLKTAQMPGAQLTVEATTRFKRSQFGMTRMLGIVADEMSISLRVVATKRD